MDRLTAIARRRKRRRRIEQTAVLTTTARRLRWEARAATPTTVKWRG